MGGIFNYDSYPIEAYVLESIYDIQKNAFNK